MVSISIEVIRRSLDGDDESIPAGRRQGMRLRRTGGWRPCSGKCQESSEATRRCRLATVYGGRGLRSERAVEALMPRRCGDRQDLMVPARQGSAWVRRDERVPRVVLPGFLATTVDDDGTRQMGARLLHAALDETRRVRLASASSSSRAGRRWGQKYGPKVTGSATLSSSVQ